MSDRPLLFHCGDLCNLGDLALLMQNLGQAAPGRRRYVRRWAPLPAEVEAQVAAAGGVLIDGRHLPSFLKVARGCDIVIGGGQLVRDNISLRSLVFQYLGALAARAGGGSIATRGLGVGAIRHPLRKALWRRLLRLATEVRVRDTASARNAASLVGEERVRLTADMAFLPSPLHQAAQSQANADDRILIAPCIDVSENRSIDGAAFGVLLSALEKALPGRALVFACHDPRPGMDTDAADRLIAAHGLHEARKADGYILQDLLDDYHHAAIVVTNRLHALIFALLAGRPLLVIDDGTRKTAAMAERFGVPSITMDRADAILPAVRAALAYDRGARADALRDMGQRAARNLD
jgi:polysaccharide pyruvyl transferase WcaK-like protein